jgi:hypothetical protein
MFRLKKTSFLSRCKLNKRYYISFRQEDCRIRVLYLKCNVFKMSSKYSLVREERGLLLFMFMMENDCSHM